TGKPKKIRISKSQMIYSAQTTCRYLHLKADNTALLCLPTRFIGGKMMVVRAFVCGLDLIPVPPSANPFSKIKEPLDFAALTPLQCFHSLQKLKAYPPGKIIIGGGGISKELESRLAYIPSPVYSTYGMTETSSHIAMRKVNGDDRSDYFRVLGSTSIDTDKRGCLIISNPFLLDSKLVTNDVVEIINDKEFKWLGRWDHVINSGGVKLIAEDMENKIAHLLSSKMLYVPLPDPVFGEIPVLVVEKEYFTNKEKEKLFMQIKSIIGKFAVPKHMLAVSSFPLTGSGKIDRIRLRELVQEKIKNLGEK
ncbi:MAG: AMP-binding protein, partial [Bacteroidota bacterium]